MVWKLYFFGSCCYCVVLIFWSLKISVMTISVYKINKGINKFMEFKGLKVQYIGYLGGGLVLFFIVFVVFYISGVNMFVCFVLVIVFVIGLFMFVYWLSNKYG